MKKDVCTLSAAENIHERTAIIVVLTARKNIVNRNLIRQTYGSIKTANNVHILAVVFMLGNSDAHGVELIDSHKLQAEIDRFGDIIVGDFVDSYRNLTLKTIMAYEWVTSYCREAQIVVKTDDDVLVNIFELTKELNSWSSDDVLSSNIWCRVHRNERTINDTRSKFYASPVDFPSGNFPDHCGGLGYVTTLNVIDRIVDEISKSFLGRVCTHEDVFITAIVLSQINSIQNVSGQKSEPIQLTKVSANWHNFVLETGSGDEDHFFRNLIQQTTIVNQTENLAEFGRRYGKTIFYLLAHTDDFKDKYVRLWQIIKKSYSN